MHFLIECSQSLEEDDQTKACGFQAMWSSALDDELRLMFRCLPNKPACRTSQDIINNLLVGRKGSVKCHQHEVMCGYCITKRKSAGGREKRTEPLQMPVESIGSSHGFPLCHLIRVPLQVRRKSLPCWSSHSKDSEEGHEDTVVVNWVKGCQGVKKDQDWWQPQGQILWSVLGWS